MHYTKYILYLLILFILLYSYMFFVLYVKKLSFFLHKNLFSFYSLILQEHKLGMSAAITAALIAFTAFVVFATALITTVIQEYTLLLQALAYFSVFIVSVNVFTEKLSENMQLINELKAKNKELEREKNNMIISFKCEIDELETKNTELASDKNAKEDELSAIIIPLKREIDNLKKYIVELHNKLKASKMRLAEKNELDDYSKNLNWKIDELETKNIELEKEKNDLDDYTKALC